MKQSVFADTCYWIALLNPRDQLHERAVTLLFESLVEV
jgi:predicted nucleic acid-binding protein